MTAEAERSWQRADASFKDRGRRAARSVFAWVKRIPAWLGEHRPFRHGFSSLTRRIVVLNLIGLAILVSGILYLNQFRAGLIDAKVQSLLTQGEIIARAIAASAGVDNNDTQVDAEKLLEKERGQAGQPDDTPNFSNALGFTIDPERAAPILRPLVKPTGSRARIYNRDGTLILDSDTFYSRGEVLRYDLPPPDTSEPDSLTKFWRAVTARMQPSGLPIYTRHWRRQRQGLSGSGRGPHRHARACRQQERQGRTHRLRGRSGAAHARRAWCASFVDARRRHRRHRRRRALGHRARFPVRRGGDRRLVAHPRQHHRRPHAAACLGGGACAP